jgi:GTP diphosphokinase / guanosine-3',5'-bis(diphosphate) 3'-diphosphatase
MRKGEMLDKAIVIATNAHAGQLDRGGRPYILHPLAVMHILNSADEELSAAAVLHDVIEDTKVTYADLRAAGISERVIVIVKTLTKLPGETYDEYKSRVMESTDAMKVKLADLTHNSDIRRLKGVTEKDIARMAKYHTFYLEITAKLEGKS